MPCARGKNGFTLVEVMVSLVIFLIASIGLLPLLMTSQQVNRGNTLHAQARTLASQVMAELQVVDYVGLTAAAEPLLFDAIEVVPQIEANTPQTDQSRITVTAVWEERGRLHRYQLQTIRSAP